MMLGGTYRDVALAALTDRLTGPWLLDKYCPVYGKRFGHYDRPCDEPDLYCGANPMRDDEFMYDAEEVVSGPPPKSIAFNPTGAIPLPAPADDDPTLFGVQIFSIRVPIGYDGVILGHYHDYIPVPAAAPIPQSIFVNGSGDLIWRISADKRFVADCGAMTVTQGSVRSLSTIAGGIQLRSGNLVRYVVSAPDPSGSLSPGLGTIVAGLHGYFYPRK